MLGSCAGAPVGQDAGSVLDSERSPPGGLLMRKILVASIVLTAVLSGCASSGKEITQEQVDRIVQGQTTQDQLISIFGKPMAEQYNSDGSRVLTWGYAYVGFIAGTETQGLSVILGPDGKVTGYSMAGSSPSPARFGR